MPQWQVLSLCPAPDCSLSRCVPVTIILRLYWTGKCRAWTGWRRQGQSGSLQAIPFRLSYSPAMTGGISVPCPLYGQPRHTQYFLGNLRIYLIILRKKNPLSGKSFAVKLFDILYQYALLKWILQRTVPPFFIFLPFSSPLILSKSPSDLKLGKKCCCLISFC